MGSTVEKTIEIWPLMHRKDDLGNLPSQIRRAGGDRCQGRSHHGCHFAIVKAHHAQIVRNRDAQFLGRLIRADRDQVIETDDGGWTGIASS